MSSDPAPQQPLHILQSGSRSINLFDSFGGNLPSGAGTWFRFRTCAGTPENPIATQATDILAYLGVEGWNGASWGSPGGDTGGLYFHADETFTAAKQGTSVLIVATPLGTNTPIDALRIWGPNCDITPWSWTKRFGVPPRQSLGLPGLEWKSVYTKTIQAAGLPVYANNAAAIAGGLTAGAFYRTGANPDPVCVVH